MSDKTEQQGNTDGLVNGTKVVVKRVKKRRRRRKKAFVVSEDKSKLTDFISNLVDDTSNDVKEDTAEDIIVDGRVITDAEKLANTDVYKLFHTDDERQRDYVDNMDEKEQLAMKIAIDHLGSSFSLWRSIGYKKFNAR